MSESKREIYVRDIGTSAIVHTVDVTGQGRRSIERTVRGMSINMNIERFWIDDMNALSGFDEEDG